MGKKRNPRHGSMQFWHRKRATRAHPRIRYTPDAKTNNILGFAGFKAGMTRVLATDNKKTSMSKGMSVSMPVTIIECPPLKLVALRVYRHGYNGEEVAKDIFVKVDKKISELIGAGKPGDLTKIVAEDYSRATLLLHTNPQLTGIGNKKPILLEFSFGGSVAEAVEFAKTHTEFKVGDLFKEGQYLDIHAVTKGKGFQGSVKRFGVSIRHHKSEKTKRGPGSLGPWKGQAHVMYRVAFPGQMGYHTRTEYNKQIIKIGNGDLHIKGGIVRYGEVKNDYVLVKGSIAGAKKRLIRFQIPIRKTRLHDETQYTIETVSEASHQGA